MLHTKPDGHDHVVDTNIGASGQLSQPSSPQSSYGNAPKRAINGGRFDFEDGGTYCGGWEEGKAHGHGVCTGPKHQGAYSGAWNYGFEASGVYIWPSGSSFEGQWQNGRRHGLGVEQRGRLIYRGEWTAGYKGRYGVRQSTTSTAKYEGTWASGLQDGYGSETYADGGSYQGQWQEGKRHGYGVRTSAPFGLASHYKPKNFHASSNSVNETADPSEKRNHKLEDVRGGFVLRANSDYDNVRRNSLTEKSKKGLFSGLKMRKQKSVGDLEKRGTITSGSIRSTVSTASWISTGSSQSVLSQKSAHTESNASFNIEEEQLDPSIIETYMGEWKRDKRDGYGISERSDGLKYEGEWHNNKKHGYGVTTFRDGTVEEGKYKNNVLITSQKKKHLFLIRSRKFRERVEASIQSAQRASKIALQKADIAISRTSTARGKAEYADSAADQARVDCEFAVGTAREFAPDFKPSVLERFERIKYRERFKIDDNIQLANKPHTMPHLHLQPQSSPNNIKDQTKLNEQESLAYKYSTNYENLNNMYSQQDNSTNINKQNKLYMNHNSPAQNQPISPAQNQPISPTNAASYPRKHSAATINKDFEREYYNNNIHNNTETRQIPSEYHNQMPTSSNIENLNIQFSKEDPQISQDNHSVSIKLNSRRLSETAKPSLGNIGQQNSIDHYDHYKRPPLRDNSVDRYTRAASRLSGQSRQPSVDRNITPINSSNTNINTNINTNSTAGISQEAPERSARPSIQFQSTITTKNKMPNGTVPNQPFEDILLRQRTLGQDIIPSFSQPKRTESLYTPVKPLTNAGSNKSGNYQNKNLSKMDWYPEDEEEEELMFSPALLARRASESWIIAPPIESTPVNPSLQRKKSLPDFQELPHSTGMMSREEVSALGSARREEVRRQIETNERLKANPFLYLVSPQMKDWFFRQQLVLLVLITNVILAIIFIKMLI